MDYFYGWRPYVTVGARRAQAARDLLRLQKNGRTLAPIRIEGRKIATTFWGKAWCDNLERYSDFANRLPRGRTYVRNGSVLDLQMARGTVTALVSGSAVYTVRVEVGAVPGARWRNICHDCTGAIESLIELLQGQLSTRVITRICEPRTGLFPEPQDVSFRCSCPDVAWMCKHVAAVLYGVGARLDERPELLFLLRGVDQQDLIAQADTGLRRPAGDGKGGKVLDTGDLSQIFDIEIAAAEAPAAGPPLRHRARTARAASAATGKRATPGTRTAPEKRTASASVKEAEAAARAPAKAATAAGRGAKHAPKPGSEAWRRSVSERMKKYWAERRPAAAARQRGAEVAAAGKVRPGAPPAKKATPAARATTPPRGAAAEALARGSETPRQAVSERMKQYWAERRRRSPG